MTATPDEIEVINKPPQEDSIDPILGGSGWLVGMFFPTFRQGRHERYGPIILSIQAGSNNYCEPRDTYLPNLTDYSEVEIALLDLRETMAMPHSDFFHRGAWTTPKRLGIEGFGRMFQNDDVEGWVKWDEIDQLREALAYWYGGKNEFVLAHRKLTIEGYTEKEWGVFKKVGPEGVAIARAYQSSQHMETDDDD